MEKGLAQLAAQASIASVWIVVIGISVGHSGMFRASMWGRCSAMTR